MPAVLAQFGGTYASILWTAGRKTCASGTRAPTDGLKHAAYSGLLDLLWSQCSLSV